MRRTIALLCFFGLLLAACNSPAEGLWPLHIGKKTLYVEIARTNDQHRIGLMYRESLPKNQGMLFVYQDKRRLSFWMKNTKVPLDVAFLGDNGDILQIEPMKPQTTQLHDSRYPVRYALEVNQGWFTRHGFKVGDTIKNLPTP
ncbi:MAG TPA: DUF192 domain-containing protein [bacterium]|nr:DUF192 domain-containing protein [bacterium]